MEAEMTDDSDGALTGDATLSTEEIIYRVVGGYLIRKLSTKHQLVWDKVKDNPALRADFEKYKERLAKDAFLAIRSRTGPDFIEYFSGTLCSVPQHIGEAGFLALTRALMTETETVRTLTLLALSARA